MIKVLHIFLHNSLQLQLSIKLCIKTMRIKFSSANQASSPALQNCMMLKQF